MDDERPTPSHLPDQDSEAVRVGAFDAANDVTDRNTCEELTPSAALLDVDDANTGRTAGGVIEGRVIARQRIRPAQRHEDTIAAGRNIHQVRRRITAHRSDQAELVHH